jgi:hypothetical protein
MSVKNHKAVNAGEGRRLALVLGAAMLLWGCLCISALSAIGQEVEGGNSETSYGAVFSNASYVELIAPLTSKIGLNLYGFYLGNLGISIALAEVPITVQKHLVLTPSYLYVNVPPPGLSLLTTKPAYRTYRENQFRLAATIVVSWHGFLFSDRNMYVRRFTPFGDFNRYRNRIYVSHSVTIERYKMTPFAFYELYHDFQAGPWPRRSWFVAAVDMPITRHLTFQPSYIRQDDQYLRSINFLGTALLIRTNQLFHPGTKRSSCALAQDGKDDAVTPKHPDMER